MTENSGKLLTKEKKVSVNEERKIEFIEANYIISEEILDNEVSFSDE